MKTTYQLATLTVVGVLAGVAWNAGLPFSLGSKADSASTRRAERKRPVPSVVVRQVRFDSDAAVIQAVGTGKALKAVTLYPEADGRVVKVHFRSGQRIKSGDPLIDLDSESEKLALRLATIQHDNAKRLLARYQKIASGQAVTLNAMQEARKALDVATVQLSQASLALRRRTLKAPFDGIVGIARVEVGDRITKTTQVASLDDRSALLVDFEVPAAFAFGVRRGMKFTATTWARRRDRFEGVVTDLSSRIDATTRTLSVRGRIPNAEDRLRTGLAFAITLPLVGQGFPAVPSVAIRWQRKGSYVWAIRNKKAVRVEASVIKRNGPWVLVDADLKPEDYVVVEGVQNLRDGRHVKVTKRVALKRKR